jgi:hypothetical protein
MNITLTVVVAAIVILITALVVITIFGSGISQVGSIAQANSVCRTQCEASCKATGSPPITWTAPTVKDADGNLKSCAEIISGGSASGGGATCHRSAGTCSYGGTGTKSEP